MNFRSLFALPLLAAVACGGEDSSSDTSSTESTATTETTTGEVDAGPEDVTLRVFTYNTFFSGTETIAAAQAANADVIVVQELQNDADLATIAGELGLATYTFEMPFDALRPVRVLTNHTRLADYTTEGSSAVRGMRFQICEGVTYNLFGVHLVPDPDHLRFVEDNPETDEDGILAVPNGDRPLQLSQIASAIGTLASDGEEPTFFLGDFNEPSHLDWTQAAADAGLNGGIVVSGWELSNSIIDLGFTDAYREAFPDEAAHPGHTWHAEQADTDNPMFAPIREGEVHGRIDFVYYAGDDVTLNSAATLGESEEVADEVVTPWLTDHRGVVAEFTLDGAVCP